VADLMPGNAADFFQASDPVLDNLAQSFQRRLSIFNFVWHATAAEKPEPLQRSPPISQMETPEHLGSF
jgi:hypothetical protein